MKAILGQKVGMTQIWDDHGRLVPATLILAKPNATVKKSETRTQIIASSTGRANRAQKFFANLIGAKNARAKEIEGLSTDSAFLKVDQFSIGDKLAITAQTKGKGFAGTIKRHNFHRGPSSHGSHNIRRPGSIGAQQPQRVPKGQKMSGQMGANQITVRGNQVLQIITDKDLLVVSGAVPGHNKAELLIKSVENGKKRN